jgi:hypothetical protein
MNTIEQDKAKRLLHCLGWLRDTTITMLAEVRTSPEQRNEVMYALDRASEILNETKGERE